MVAYALGVILACIFLPAGLFTLGVNAVDFFSARLPGLRRTSESE